MGAVSSCCGGRRQKEHDVEEGLLAEYQDETVLQARVHEKMHTYQMLQALSSGYMPSNEQLIANLRTLLASDVLNPDNDEELSDSGRKLTRACKQSLKDLMQLFQDKNSEDQIQDFIWTLSKARLSVNTKDAKRQAKSFRGKADATAAYESLRTVGTLLLSNPDFRIFLSDLQTIARHVFAKTAYKVSDVADETAKTLEPSKQDKRALESPEQRQGAPPGKEDLAAKVEEAGQVVGDGALQVAKEGANQLKEDLSGDSRRTLLQRLKETVVNLRQRTDYSESVSTISLLIQRYAEAYSQAADKTITAVQEDVHSNEELDEAARKFWSLLRSFGEEKEWDALKDKMDKVMQHSQADPDFESLIAELGSSIEKLLLDPDFFDTAEDKIQELQEKSKKAGSESSLRQDIDAALTQARRTLNFVVNDADITALYSTVSSIPNILFPSSGVSPNHDLLADTQNVFLPLLISAIQHIPIPRIELSTPDIDLLLESLVIEPGRTVNHTSFLPHRMHLTTRNDIDIRAARTRTVSSATTVLTLTISGLTVRAEDIGFWMRLHSGILRYAASGLASAALDGTGLELELDIEVSRANIENILTLRAARVRAPTLDYTLASAPASSSTWALPWFVACTRPFVRPVIRHALERGIADAVADACRFVNRELVFARERLRATRVADPDDWVTFVRAVAARWVPEEDPDVFARVGVRPSQGVFRGVYAPGSVVKVWEEEGRRAGDKIEDEAKQGWRNEIFDVVGTSTGRL